MPVRKDLWLVWQKQLEQTLLVFSLEISHRRVIASVNQHNAVNVWPERTKKEAALKGVAAKVSRWVVAKPIVESFAVKLVWVKGHVTQYHKFGGNY